MLLRKGDRSVLPTECVRQVGMGMVAGQQVERRPGLGKAFRSDSAGGGGEQGQREPALCCYSYPGPTPSR